MASKMHQELFHGLFHGLLGRKGEIGLSANKNRNLPHFCSKSYIYDKTNIRRLKCY